LKQEFEIEIKQRAKKGKDNLKKKCIERPELINSFNNVGKTVFEFLFDFPLQSKLSPVQLEVYSFERELFY